VSQSQKTTSRPASEGASEVRWVVVELTHAGEQEKKSEVLTRAVQRILGSRLRVFVPSLSTDVRQDSQILVYMDGYVFVEYLDGVQYMKLRDTSYFNDVLCSSKGSSPVYSLIRDEEINGIKKDMESIRDADFDLDDRVVVKSGTNRGLSGTVLDVDGDNITVKHHTRSKPCILTYKSTYLEKAKPRE
jgi:transcription antitermination factor NusG